MSILDEPAAPAGDTPDALPPYELYSVRQISVGTFLGGPLAGVWMLRWNFRHLGDELRARATLWIGVAATAALLALLWVLPEEFPGGILPAVYMAATAGIAKTQQGLRIERHWERGGSKRSSWHVVGVSAASLGILAAVFVGAVFAAPEDKVEFGDGQEVYFEDGATEKDARRVGEFLTDYGFFTGERAVTVTVGRDDPGYVVSFVLSGGWNEPDLVTAFSRLARDVSAGALDGAPVDVRLTDAYASTKNVIEWSPD